MVKIAPSILSADFLSLSDQLWELEQAGADRIHVDVMDGHFVPNLSLGLPIVNAVCIGTMLPVEVHLMIEQPERFIDDFVQAGSDRIIVHQEASPHLHRIVQQIKHLKNEASVALNPSSPLMLLDDILNDLDGVLIMTVNPGFGGQQFIKGTLPKIRQLHHCLKDRHLECEIEVDGGVDHQTAPLAVDAGAHVLVAGTGIFEDPDGPGSGLRKLRSCCAQSHLIGSNNTTV